MIPRMVRHTLTARGRSGLLTLFQRSQRLMAQHVESYRPPPAAATMGDPCSLSNFEAVAINKIDLALVHHSPRHARPDRKADSK